MSRFVQWIGLAALSLSVVGCVSQEKYNTMRLDRDRALEQLGVAQAEASGARGKAQAYDQLLASMRQKEGGTDAMVLNLTQQNGELQRQLDEVNRRYQEAV